MGRSIQRRGSRRRTRTTLLLVTNGAKTEKAYLEALKKQVSHQSGLSIKTSWQDGKEPETILEDLRRSRGGLDEVDEVWIIVDHDGQDRRRFLDACRRVKGTKVFGVISVPCFEVWLNAHYEQVRRYQDQEQAQRHYRELTGLSARQGKALPQDFPFNRSAEAAERCCLQGTSLPGINMQGPCPSTTMPHLLRRLGLL
ncbi:RloB family protein [Actinomyces slackii]|uniref:RloB-like protein n=1 Tax=Actinomyces slackii TaxID=52774 RepID=A0A3S4WIK0_9ACTO|nr:RloB family protein [Actinomyces slackii]VEG73702.1 Uncharacterised protein [Actinomyces slackii]